MSWLRLSGPVLGRLIVGAALVPALLSAQGRPAVAPAPVPGSELRISVLTMGVGAASWERFGHNAIVVEDGRQGTATAYNYGMFSFRSENFLLRFVQGRMLYWMAGYDANDVVASYRRAGRSVWEQELNLTPAQRVAFRDFLEWNARPENKFYRYDYYRDNCSTRVRDAVDSILGGAFKAQMQDPAEGTWRFHTWFPSARQEKIFSQVSSGLIPRMNRQGCSFTAEADQRPASNMLSSFSFSTGLSRKARGLQRFRASSLIGE